MSSRGRPLERNVQKKILEALRKRGGHWDNTTGNPYERRGRADIIGVFLGVYVALEVKRDKAGKPTALQIFFLKKVRDAGGVGYVIWTVGQAMTVLDRIERSHKERELTGAASSEFPKQLPE